MSRLSDPLATHGECECAWCDPHPEDLTKFRPVETINVQGELL